MPLYPSTQVSPAFSGDPTAPTPTAGDDDTSVATTEFVTDAVATQAATDAGTYGRGISLGMANGTDDTARINEVLTSAAVLGISRVFGIPGQAYLISDRLVISSGTTLDMTACTITEIEGSGKQLICNTAHAVGTGTDTNITLIGGTWNRQNNDTATVLSRHCLVFQRVNGLTIRDLTVTSTSGKFAILVYACTNFEVRQITADVSADVVHMQGACSKGHVSDIYGVAHDDIVALVPVDYAAYNNGDLGDSSDIVIERVFAANVGAAGNTVKVLAGNISGTPTTTRRITIRDIAGSSPQQVVYLGGDPADAGCIGGVLEGVNVENVVNTGTGHAVNLLQATMRDVRLARIYSPPTAYKYAIQIAAGTVAEDITVEDCYFNAPAATFAINLAPVSPYPSVTTMRVNNCRLKVAGNSGGLVATGGASATLSELHVQGLYVDGAAWPIGDFFTATNVWMHDVHVLASVGWFNVRAGATVDVKSASGLISDVVDFTSAGTVKSRSAGFGCDTSKLTQAANDLAYNTNAGNAYGVGQVVSDGTTWRRFDRYPETAFVTVSSNGIYTPPGWASYQEIIATGGSGGGGGGGSALTSGGVATQVGGGGGAAAMPVRAVVPAVALTISLGAAGAVGLGGAENGNAGTAGGPGGDTTITGTGVSITAKGARGGAPGGANSTTTVGGGAYGCTGTTTATSHGSGGFASSGTGAAGGHNGEWAGGAGGGGCPAAAGLGGNAGNSGTLNLGGAQGSGTTGSSAGGTATAPTVPGAGGGGGGGGAPGGAGGAGAEGTAGQVTIRYMA